MYGLHILVVLRAWTSRWNLYCLVEQLLTVYNMNLSDTHWTEKICPGDQLLETEHSSITVGSWSLWFQLRERLRLICWCENRFSCSCLSISLTIAAKRSLGSKFTGPLALLWTWKHYYHAAISVMLLESRQNPAAKTISTSFDAFLG